MTLLRLLILFVVIGVLVPLTPLAYSEPPDPIWIGGIYDDADLDDAVWLITSAVDAVDPSPFDSTCSELIFLALLPQPDEDAEPSATPSSIRPRAPPAA